MVCLRAADPTFAHAACRCHDGSVPHCLRTRVWVYLLFPVLCPGPAALPVGCCRPVAFAGSVTRYRWITFSSGPCSRLRNFLVVGYTFTTLPPTYPLFTVVAIAVYRFTEIYYGWLRCALGWNTFSGLRPRWDYLFSVSRAIPIRYGWLLAVIVTVGYGLHLRYLPFIYSAHFCPVVAIYSCAFIVRTPDCAPGVAHYPTFAPDVCGWYITDWIAVWIPRSYLCSCFTPGLPLIVRYALRIGYLPVFPCLHAILFMDYVGSAQFPLHYTAARWIVITD